MKSTVWTLFLAASAAVVEATYHGRYKMRLPVPAIKQPNKIVLEHFEQLVDHSNPSLGTFSQRYWYNSEYWKGSGSPIVLFTPGEEDASGYIGYCDNVTLTGAIAQEIGAAAIVLEHRYWGESAPVPDLTTANMQYLTLENNIQDLVYFAENVKLPFAKGAKANAQNSPWVLVGGSYSGALTAWTASVSPGTFWAYLATSAPVQTISNFWSYFAPVQQGMPKNCSADVNRVVTYIDGVISKGSAQEIQQLKAKFGLQNVQHNLDFLSALQNGPWAWQELSFTSPGGFFEWCDYVENSVNVTDPSKLPGANGVGLTKALEGYATWFKTVELPGFCEGYYGFSGTDNTQCFNSYNPNNPLYANTSINNDYDRAWNWMLCNEPLTYWQDGVAPPNFQSIVSRLLTPSYYSRQCGLWFPPGPQGQTYGLNAGKKPKDVVAYTGGWEFTNTTRLIYTNGQFDPWRSGSVSSQFRPGGPLQSSPGRPVFLIPDGVHCYDLIMSNGAVNPPLKAIQNAEIAQIAKWVSQYKAPQPYPYQN